MATEPPINEIIQSLAFEVEAVPRKEPADSSRPLNSTPMNVKIKVKKKDDSGMEKGILSVPKFGNPDAAPERIRLISSDQTIMSFDVSMEADFSKKPKRKPRKFFGGCLGLQYDDDEPAYSPGVYGAKTEGSVSSKSDGVIKPYVLTKYDDPILGKCKPGGCLDPPFGEDKYAYEPVKKQKLKREIPSINEESTPTKIKDSKRAVVPNVPPESKTSKHSIDSKKLKTKANDSSILSIYEANQKSSLDSKYSDSVITYPPTHVSPTTMNNEKKLRSSIISETKQRPSYDENKDGFYSSHRKPSRFSNRSSIEKSKTDVNATLPQSHAVKTKDTLPKTNEHSIYPSDQSPKDSGSRDVDEKKAIKPDFQKNTDDTTDPNNKSKFAAATLALPAAILGAGLVKPIFDKQPPETTDNIDEKEYSSDTSNLRNQELDIVNRAAEYDSRETKQDKTLDTKQKSTENDNKKPLEDKTQDFGKETNNTNRDHDVVAQDFDEDTDLKRFLRSSSNQQSPSPSMKRKRSDKVNTERQSLQKLTPGQEYDNNGEPGRGSLILSKILTSDKMETNNNLDKPLTMKNNLESTSITSSNYKPNKESKRSSISSSKYTMPTLENKTIADSLNLENETSISSLEKTLNLKKDTLLIATPQVPNSTEIDLVPRSLFESKTENETSSISSPENITNLEKEKTSISSPHYNPKGTEIDLVPRSLYESTLASENVSILSTKKVPDIEQGITSISSSKYDTHGNEIDLVPRLYESNSENITTSIASSEKIPNLEKGITSISSPKYGLGGNDIDLVPGTQYESNVEKETSSISSPKNRSNLGIDTTSKSNSLDDLKVANLEDATQRISSEQQENKSISEDVKLLDNDNLIHPSLRTIDEDDSQRFQDDHLTSIKEETINDLTKTSEKNIPLDSTSDGKRYNKSTNDLPSTKALRDYAEGSESLGSLSLLERLNLDSDAPYDINDALKLKKSSKSSLRNDIVSLDFAFQSYVNDKKERMLKTLDSTKDVNRLPNDTITEIRSQLKANVNEVKIPVDLENEIFIQLKRIRSPLRVDIRDGKSLTKNGRDVQRLPRDSDFKNLDARCSSTVGYLDDMASFQIQKVLNNVYEQELVPLQKTIKNLRKEIDTILRQQSVLVEEFYKIVKAKPVRLIGVNAKCGCWK